MSIEPTGDADSVEGDLTMHGVAESKVDTRWLTGERVASRSGPPQDSLRSAVEDDVDEPTRLGVLPRARRQRGRAFAFYDVL